MKGKSKNSQVHFQVHTIGTIGDVVQISELCARLRPPGSFDQVRV